MQRECEATVTVQAPAEAVWAVVSDVTRTGEWSGECRGCEWVRGATGATPGARFKGRNERGRARWARLNEIDVADASTELAWHTVMKGVYRDSTQWRIMLRPGADGQGTTVTESLHITHLSRPFEWLFERVMPAHRDRTGDLADDLARLKAVVEGSPSST